MTIGDLLGFFQEGGQIFLKHNQGSIIGSFPKKSFFANFTLGYSSLKEILELFLWLFSVRQYPLIYFRGCLGTRSTCTEEVPWIISLPNYQRIQYRLNMESRLHVGKVLIDSLKYPFQSLHGSKIG